MDDVYDIDRFIRAQDCVYESVLDELRCGQKKGHWMWYIFPQIAGLGNTEISKKYALSSAEEATIFLNNPILNYRLIECSQLVLKINEREAEDIFGPVDSLKFLSSMTLFDFVSQDTEIFSQCIAKYYGGIPDHQTIEILELA